MKPPLKGKRVTPASWKHPLKPLRGKPGRPKSTSKRGVFDKWMRPVALSLGGTFASATNGDKTLDAELIIPIRRGQTLAYALQDLEAALRPGFPKFKFWFREGLSIPLARPQVLYGRKRKGQFRYLTFWSHSHNWLLTFVTLRQVGASLKRHKRRKPNQIIIRAYWSPSMKQPDQGR